MRIATVAGRLDSTACGWLWLPLVVLGLTCCGSPSASPYPRASARASAFQAAATPAPVSEALDRLAASGTKFRLWNASPRALDARTSCGVRQGVVLLRGPTGVRYSKAPRLEATFALKLVRFEAIAQEEALRIFGRRLSRIDHLGTFVCRSIARASGVPSQHAFGNAIDVAAFELKGGHRITVARDFVRAGARPEAREGQFLAAVLERVAAEHLFGTVLTPDFDQKHASHLHLDGIDRRHWWWPLA